MSQSRISAYPSRPPSRPPSEQLCDLHVYKVPLDLWRAPLNNILNQSVTDTISVGIIRVPPDLPLIDIRQEIQKQLEDLVPRDYVFLRSVGRSLTRLKTKQEYQLKAKHFLPPVHYAPELFLLEATPDIREALAISDRSSNQSPNSVNRGSPRSYRDGYRSYRDRNGYQSDPRYSERGDPRYTDRGRQRAPDRTSPVRRYSPLPRINPTSPTPSREPSPAFVTDHGQDRQRLSDSQDSVEANGYHRQRPKQRGYQEGAEDEGYPPYHARPGYKESPERASPRKEPDNVYGRNRRPPPETFRKDERSYDRRDDENSGPDPDHDPDPDPDTVHPLDRSPQQSREASPIRRGAPALTHRGAHNGYEQRDAAYTTNTNEDSGVAGMTPEDQYKNRDKENFYDSLNSKARDMQNRLDRDRLNVDDDEEERRRLQEMEDKAMLDRERWEADQEERRRRAEEDKFRSEEERKKEESRRWAEEEARRQAEEEAARKQAEEEERKKREEAERLKASDEELSRFPSPPPLRMSSDDYETRDTASARQRRREEKKKLLGELEEAKETRRNTEKEREELVRKAKNLQTKTQNRRNHARDVWKKRYFEEKKKTPPLEEQTNRLREELEALHRKLMTTLEGPKEKGVKVYGDARPSQKNNYVIQCTKLQHDIDDLRRRVENAKMKLTAEMKLRTQAETELRAVRAEAIEKKIHLRGHPFQVY